VNIVLPSLLGLVQKLVVKLVSLAEVKP